jgi:hypothetical protein
MPRKKRQQNVESQESKTKTTSNETGSSWENHAHKKVSSVFHILAVW